MSLFVCGGQRRALLGAVRQPRREGEEKAEKGAERTKGRQEQKGEAGSGQVSANLRATETVGSPQPIGTTEQNHMGLRRQ